MPYGLWSVRLLRVASLSCYSRVVALAAYEGFKLLPNISPTEGGGGQKGDSSSPRNKSQKRCTLKKSGGFMMKAEERLMMCVSCELTE